VQPPSVLYEARERQSTKAKCFDWCVSDKIGAEFLCLN
jgi:hypothetical protein